MHSLVTQSSRIRSLLGFLDASSCFLTGLESPTRCISCSHAVYSPPPPPTAASRGPLVHGESPILKGQRTSRFTSGSFPLGTPRNVSVWLQSHILDQPAPTKPQVRRLQERARLTSGRTPWPLGTGQDCGSRRAPRRQPVGSSKNRPHSLIRSSPNTRPGGRGPKPWQRGVGLSTSHPFLLASLPALRLPSWGGPGTVSRT